MWVWYDYVLGWDLGEVVIVVDIYFFVGVECCVIWFVGNFGDDFFVVIGIDVG